MPVPRFAGLEGLRSQRLVCKAALQFEYGERGLQQNEPLVRGGLRDSDGGRAIRASSCVVQAPHAY